MQGLQDEGRLTYAEMLLAFRRSQVSGRHICMFDGVTKLIHKNLININSLIQLPIRNLFS